MFERGPLFATMAQQIGIVTLAIAVAFGTLLYTLSQMMPSRARSDWQISHKQ